MKFKNKKNFNLKPVYFDEIHHSIDVIVNPEINKILEELDSGYTNMDEEFKYLSKPSPNIIEWVTGVEYWNVPSTFKYWGQYQLLRDFFNLRCRICNSSRPDLVSCWGKSRSYLESENLLVWSKEHQDFQCPKCKTTMREFIEDEIVNPYNELIAIVGMRGGKSYSGAHIGGYLEHMMIVWGIEESGTLQRKLGQERSEWFEINYAASTEKQAEKTIYSKYRQMRRGSSWMNRYMDWVKKKEKEQIGVKDPWKYRVSGDEIYDGYIQARFNRVSSDSSGVAGATRFATFLDEWARLVNTEGTRSAWELYRVLNSGLRTIRSAAIMNSEIPYFFGMMTAITSAVADDDPAMQTYNKVQDGTLKRTYAIKNSTWEFNPFQPREVFDEEYERDPVAADRDFGSNPPTAVTPFIEDPYRFWKSINWDKKPIAEFSNTYPNDPTGREYVGIQLDHCELDTINQHFIFGDAGKSLDSFALACGHPKWISINEIGDEELINKNKIMDSTGRILPVSKDGVVWPEEIGEFVRPNRGADEAFITRMNHERMMMINQSISTPISGTPYEHKGEVLCTDVDFCVRIIPEIGRNVWFDSIIDVIEELRKKIRITTVCFDRWNSTSTVQKIRSMGIQSYEITLKIDNFMEFRNMVNGGRVFMLPPNEDDKIHVDESGKLYIGTNQELMSGNGVVLVELLKLSRSKDLKNVYNINKGRIRGRNSDDLARCIMGLHNIIQNSVVDEMANLKKKRAIKKKLLSSENIISGNIYRGVGR